MRVATIHAPGDIRLEERPAPTVSTPTDAIVRVTAACICGSDLWPYRGENDLDPEPQPIGHEAVGIVEEPGSDVSGFDVGDFVIIPFVTVTTRARSVARACRPDVSTAA